jgi:hypothetical protein
VPTGRPRYLVETLADALVLPRERWQEMGRAALARVRDLFKPDRVLSETLATYDSLLAEVPRCAA